MWNSHSRRFKPLARRFARDRSGNVAFMFALSFVPMLAFAGTAIDYGRAIQARDNLRQTTDAASLAIARGAANGANADLGAVASNLLAKFALGSGASLAGPPMASADRARVCLDTVASIETSFMRIAGMTTVHVTASACATADGPGVAIALEQRRADRQETIYVSSAMAGGGR